MIRRTTTSQNELFPSSDWRYLLPRPKPSTVVTLGTGWAPSVARRLWSGTPSLLSPAASGDVRPNERADLVVADSFDIPTLEQVSSLLAPEGVAYIEADWPRLVSPDGLTRRLGRCGLEPGPMYSISPARHRWAASWWIPVGSVAAVRFVAAHIHSGPSPNLRLRDLRRRAPAGLAGMRSHLVAHRPWLLHPTRPHRLAVVTGHKRLDATDLDTYRSFLPRLRPSLDQTSGQTMSDVVMRVGGSSTDQGVLFFFAHCPEPVAVIKAPIRPEEIIAGGHEADMLEWLAAPPEPLDSVPKPVPVLGRSGYEAWGQSYAPGLDMTKLVSPSDLDRYVAPVSEWLIRLAARTTRKATQDFTASTRRDLTRLGHSLLHLPDGRELTRGILASWGRIREVDTVCQHRDLGPWNIRVDERDRLTVIDWADSVTTGLPVCDLVHFVAHLCLCAYDSYGLERRKDVIAGLMEPSSRTGRMLTGYISSHAAGVGVAADIVDDLRVVTWALDLLRRPSAERSESLYLDLLRAELRRIGSSP